MIDDKTKQGRRGASCQSIGSFHGVLEEINLHNTRKFYIYDKLGNKIECIFPESLLEELRNLIGKRVEVRGTATYRNNPIAPDSLDVSSIEGYKPVALDPELRNLYGAYPEWGGKKTAAEMIRTIRDAE